MAILIIMMTWWQLWRDDERPPSPQSAPLADLPSPDLANSTSPDDDDQDDEDNIDDDDDDNVDDHQHALTSWTLPLDELPPR